MMDIFLKVFLKSSAGEVELSTHDQEAPYRLLDGTRGFGLPQRSVESTPIPSGNGSAFRSQRFDESEMMLPISIRGMDASDVAEKARELEHVLMPASNEPIEIRVVAPQLSTTRRRFIYYMGGLEGAIGSQDSHWVWRHAQVTFTALDPMWYGRERVMPQRVDQGRKPFIPSKLEEPAEGAVVPRADRAPTADDAGTDGDVWFVGKHGRDEVVEATNFIINGNFANGTTGWTISSTSTLAADSAFASRMWADSFGYQASEAPMARATLGSTSLNMSQVNNSFTGTGFVAFSALVASESGAEIRSTIGFRNASGSPLGNVSSEWATADYYDGRRVLHVATIPPGTGQITVQLNFRGVAGNRMWVDRVMAVRGESEASAVAHSETYFDGDTPDGPTVNDPHYRYADDGASEKYLPATEFKPTDRYVHNGTEWEQVELEKRAPFFPVVLASSVIEGAYQLNIQGDANAWPIWEITGPGEDLLIENTETKERIFIQGEFGEKVNIDTRPTIAHIYSETKDEGELWERVDDDYRLFPLNPGLNKIRITMVNARPNSLVRLRYSETWLAGW